MSVLTRDVLESSTLADLHALAGELQIDGFRRLRREQLVDTIIERRGGDASDEEPREGGRRRRRRGGRRDEDRDEPTTSTVAADEEPAEEPRGRRRRRGGRDEADEAPREDAGKQAAGTQVADGETVEGTISVTPNGSALLSAADGAEVYVSAGQVRRCELVDGDRVSGPTRPARRSERFPSLVRVETINGRPADETVPDERFDDLDVLRPHELLVVRSEDPTVSAIAWLTPIGRGSRALLTGPHASGKTEALRRLAVALRDVDGVELLAVLAGARPEELGDWREGGVTPVAALDLSEGPEQRTKAIDEVVERGRRIAARGGHAVVLVDTLDGLGEGAARRILSAARRLGTGGSLTIVATREQPVGGESTVVVLDRALAATGRFPALDLAASTTLRPELLVGEEGAAAIAAARAELLEG